MSWYWIVGIVLVVLVVAFVVFLALVPDELQPLSIKSAHLEEVVAAMLGSQEEDVFAIVQDSSSGSFLQMRRLPGKIEIDFPLVTDDQKSKEARIIAAGKQLRLHHKINTGTDGTRFIDFYVDESPPRVAQILVGFLSEVYGVRPESQLILKGSGFDYQEPPP